MMVIFYTNKLYTVKPPPLVILAIITISIGVKQIKYNNFM